MKFGPKDFKNFLEKWNNVWGTLKRIWKRIRRWETKSDRVGRPHSIVYTHLIVFPLPHTTIYAIEFVLKTNKPIYSRSVNYLKIYDNRSLSGDIQMSTYYK
jgi:hypothetical protein